MHTDLGRQVLGRVAKAQRIPRETLSTLWFYFESALLDRGQSDGWWPRWVETILCRSGYASVLAAEAEWNRVRPEVQARVEAMLPAALAEVERWAVT